MNLALKKVRVGTDKTPVAWQTLVTKEYINILWGQVGLPRKVMTVYENTHIQSGDVGMGEILSMEPNAERSYAVGVGHRLQRGDT